MADAVAIGALDPHLVAALTRPVQEPELARVEAPVEAVQDVLEVGEDRCAPLEAA
jgi:hypothetical protein